METSCKQCHKLLTPAIYKNRSKKIFCDLNCQQEFWRIARNETGEQRRDKRMLGNEIRKTHHLNAEQIQIVYGGLLGDSSICPRSNGACRIKTLHAAKQLPYLEFKKKLMEPFIIQDQPTKELPSKSFPNSQICYSYSTIVHQDFTDLYPIFYKKELGKPRRSITMKTLLPINPFGILIWYLDDGSLVHSEKKSSTEMRIGSNTYTLSEHKILKSWLWHHFRVESVIAFEKTHKCYFLRFNKEGRNTLLDLFEPYIHLIPDCMKYKLIRF